jgi:7-cyano-7-deazaguanine synthase
VAKAKAVAILSGGLDSSVSLALARHELKPVLALFFDYGQRARRPERKASRALARHFKVRWKEVSLPWLGEVTSTGLVRGRVPRLKEGDLDSRRRSRGAARQVWVPNRNGLFLNVAAAFAEGLGAKYVIAGFDREEAATFPDNSREFIQAVNRSFSYSTLSRVKVKSFVGNMTKAAIVAHGIKQRVPLHLTWSCYQGGKDQCGSCESCLRVRRAFRVNMSPRLWGGVGGRA